MDHKKRISHRYFVAVYRENKNPMSLHATTPLRALNSNGFVTTMALTLLPIMISAALCSFGTIWFIEQKEKIQWICETQNLKAQSALTDGVNQLLYLNPLITAAVIDRKFVKLSLAVAVTPAEKAVLTARLIALTSQLMGYKAQQQAILLSAHALAGAEIFTAKQKLQGHVSYMEASWKNSLRLFFISRPYRIKLRKKKIDPLAVTYLEPPFLSMDQEILVHFSISGEKLFPHWMEWLIHGRFLWNESCKSQPKKENLKWVAKIILDKF